MKMILVILAVAAFAFADNDGCTSMSHGHQSPTTDDVVLTVENDWALPAGAKALGIDVFENGSSIYILGTDNTNGYIQAWDASTGGALGTLPLDAANASCFGVAWNNDPDTDTYYTDDWQDTVLYYTENFGVSWTTVANPAGSSARGMDFDGTDYWTTNAAGGGLWRFQPGVGASNLSIPEVPSGDQPSGVAVWDYMGDVAVAVTTYGNHNIWIYLWDGSTLTFHGSAACPVSCSSSYGLAYSENNGHLYWSFNNSGYHLADLTIDMVSLSRDTWAGIKTSF